MGKFATRSPQTGAAQTHPKYQYRFMALDRANRQAKPCKIIVEATSEHEARKVLAPHYILSLSAVLPVQEVRHV
ncbi:host cell division inhibitor Icd-like protein [Salmonella enterica]